jgi:hypothetical protein
VWWVDALPWLGADGASGVEDWYLVGDWSALGHLNDQAVSGHAGSAHDAVAELTGNGAGALYGLRGGDPESVAQPCAAWLSKPPGMPYPDFYERMSAPLGAPGASLWQRQLVLGPTPEFCLLSPTPVVAPPDAELSVTRRRLR